MPREKYLNPRYAVALLAAMTLAVIYFTSNFVDERIGYFKTLADRVDEAFEQAYGRATVTEQK